MHAGLAGGRRRGRLILGKQVLVELLLLPHADARRHQQAHLQRAGQRKRNPSWPARFVSQGNIPTAPRCKRSHQQAHLQWRGSMSENTTWPASSSLPFPEKKIPTALPPVAKRRCNNRLRQHNHTYFAAAPHHPLSLSFQNIYIVATDSIRAATAVSSSTRNTKHSFCSAGNLCAITIKTAVNTADTSTKALVRNNNGHRVTQLSMPFIIFRLYAIPQYQKNPPLS